MSPHSGSGCSPPSPPRERWTLWAQIDGLVAGYNSVAPSNAQFETVSLLFLNAQGDLGDIISAIDASGRHDFETMSYAQVSAACLPAVEPVRGFTCVCVCVFVLSPPQLHPWARSRRLGTVLGTRTARQWCGTRPTCSSCSWATTCGGPTVRWFWGRVPVWGR